MDNNRVDFLDIHLNIKFKIKVMFCYEKKYSCNVFINKYIIRVKETVNRILYK